jgi:hypothetical protein
MQKATIQWNETNNNLKQICDKYKGAVKLWRRYCDESEVIRNEIDQHFSDVDDLMENKSAEEIEVNIPLKKFSFVILKLVWPNLQEVCNTN